MRHPSQLSAEEVATCRRYKGPVETVGRLTLERFEETWGQSLLQRTKYSLRIWKGKALKPLAWYSSSYPDAIQEKHHKIAEAETRYLALQADAKALDAKMRQALKDRVAVPFGIETIFECSWGYDQTNVDFYQVTAVDGAKVTLHRLCQDTEETGFMCGNTTPRPSEFRGEAITKIVQVRNGQFYLAHDHGCLTVWDGKPARCSWYA